MHGVMREVQEERLLALDDLGDVFFGFNSEGLGKERVRVMVLVEMRDGVMPAARAFAVFLFRVITTGRAKGSPADIDVEAEV